MEAMEIKDRSHIDSEQRNPRCRHLHKQSIRSLISLICDEDRDVLMAVEGASEAICSFLHDLEPRFRRGGRLIYIGAGTSGRLGVLDAAEMGPTFQLESGRIIGVIAGGDHALRYSSEGLEDSWQGAQAELLCLDLNEEDTLLGISAGGTTPYVLGALEYAKENHPGILTGFMTCSEVTQADWVDRQIHLGTGPEVVAGSTRMKAGTATKMALNMISTALMIRCGFVHDNLMVKLSVSNNKLLDRAARILCTITNMSRQEALQALDTERDLVKHVEPKALSKLPQLQLHMDAGASKTRVSIVGDGIAMDLEGGPGNILEIGRRAMREMLNGLFADLYIGDLPFRQIAGDCRLYAGMAGACAEGMREQLLGLLEEQGFDPVKVELCNDVEMLLQNADEAKIVLAAGTGSYCIGMHGKERFHAGGLGKVLGDEGSGYWIGLESIKAAMAEASSALARVVKKKLRVEDIASVIAPITQGEYRKDQIAALTPLVFDLAERGDDAAKDILDRAAEQLFALLQDVRAQMGTAGCDLHYEGSLLTKRNYLKDRIAEMEKRRVGQCCIDGFEGAEAPDELLERLRDGRLGGVILFDRNIESPKQLRRLTATLKAAGARYIAIDQEGGLVSRLPASKGFPEFPSAASAGAGLEEAMLEQAELLYSLGINLNFAPVVDLPRNPENFIVAKERCYGDDVATVVEKAKLVIDAHRAFGITTVLKHFPGHGSSTADSHEGVADITSSWDRSELEPFRQLIADGYADMVMLGHLINQNVDPEYPASLSAAHVQLLRKELGYDGPLITDDLAMAAIRGHYSQDEATQLALQAGVDLILHGHQA